MFFFLCPWLCLSLIPSVCCLSLPSVFSLFPVCYFSWFVCVLSVWVRRSLSLLPSLTCLLLPISQHTCNPSTNQAPAVYILRLFAPVSARSFRLQVLYEPPLLNVSLVNLFPHVCRNIISSCVYLCVMLIFPLGSRSACLTAFHSLLRLPISSAFTNFAHRLQGFGLTLRYFVGTSVPFPKCNLHSFCWIHIEYLFKTHVRVLFRCDLWLSISPRANSLNKYCLIETNAGDFVFKKKRGRAIE